MNIRSKFVAATALSLLLLSACGIAPAVEPARVEQPVHLEQPVPAQALSIESLRPLAVDYVTTETGPGSPGRLEIVAEGTWPDWCAQLALMTTRIHGMEIEVELHASAADPACPPDYLGVPFLIRIPLNPVQLPAGTYTVTVNSYTTTFVWQP